MIAYYSKTYMGIGETLHKYNFGLGVTGGDAINLDKYRVLLMEKEYAMYFFVL